MSKKGKRTDFPEYGSLFFSKVTDFLDIYLVKQAGKSFYTRKSYKTGLSSFYDYVTESLRISPMHFQFSQCSYQLVLGYSEHLQNLQKKNSTVNARIAAIKSYLEYASDCDAANISVFVSVSRVPFLSIPKVQMPIIHPDDMAVFLDAPEHTRIGNRDRFILIMFFDSAVRVSELVSITLGDIVDDNGEYTILIHGKGRKERCIILSEKASQHMKVYLKTYHAGVDDMTRPLFFTTIHGKISAMSVRNVERILNKYGDLARKSSPGIPNSVSPHTLRRSRATALYRDGIPIEQVSAFLGHSQIETTRSHYASPSPEQMKNAVEKGSAQEPEQRPEWTEHIEDLKRKFGLD